MIATQTGMHIIDAVGETGNSGDIYWSGIQNVVFPVLFNEAPSVTLTPVGSAVGWAYCSTVNATGFSYRFVRIGSTPVAGQQVMWSASVG